MSGAARTVSIRVSTEGAERARKDLEQFGTAGEAALRRVEGAAAATSPAMQRLAGASDGLARSVAAMPGPMGNAARQVQGLAAGLSTAGGGFAAAAAAAAFGVAVVASLGATVRVAEQYERLGLRTAAVIKATEGAAGLSAAQIRALAIDIGDVTLASATEVEAAAQKLLTFRAVAGDVFESTLRLAQDLAAVGFGDISSAAVQLGKALESPADGLAGLSRIGITFSAAQKAVIKQLDDTGQTAEVPRLILARVAKQVGGAGVGESGGLSGAYDDLGDNVEKFLLRIGNAGPIQVASAAINVLATSVAGLNLIFDAGKNLFTGGSGVAAADNAVARAMRQVRTAETPDSYGMVNKPALDAANSVLLDALAVRTQIVDAAEKAQAGILALAETARVETARENANVALVALEQSLSARLRAEEEYAKAVQTIDRGVREVCDRRRNLRCCATMCGASATQHSLPLPVPPKRRTKHCRGRASGRLAAGGGVDEFAQTARQVLPVARGFLGTSERYASLVADVADAVTGAGGDPSGLGALLQAQVDGGDALRETFARYGERQLDVATATLTEFRRLASSIEALLARRVA